MNIQRIENKINSNVINFMLNNNTQERNITLPEGMYKIQIVWYGNPLHIPSAPAYLTISQAVNSAVIPLTGTSIYYLYKKELIATDYNNEPLIYDIYFYNINRKNNLNINFYLDYNSEILDKFMVTIIPINN